MNKIRSRVYLVLLLFLMIVPVAFSLGNFIPSSPLTGKHSGAVPTRAAAEQGAFSPSPSLFFKNGSSWLYGVSTSEQDISNGTTSTGFAGLTYQKNVLLWGGTANQYEYQDTIVVINASDTAYQDQIGVKQTTSNSEDIPSGGIVAPR